MMLSIITACFNHGQYLDEMITSVINNDWSFKYEHIIVNDGSSDVDTLKKLDEISTIPNVVVVHQQNKGLAKARNAGLHIAKGKYILPLDSDNKIRPLTIEKGINFLVENDLIDVVYTDAQCFEDKNDIWKVGPLDRDGILIMNQIDACALIKKKIFDELGFYDESMPGMGNEDWELWIRFMLNAKVFYYLPEVGYDYRVVNTSMSALETRPKYDSNRRYLVEKYPLQYHNLATKLFENNRSLLSIKEKENKSPVRTFIKNIHYKYLNKI